MVDFFQGLFPSQGFLNLLFPFFFVFFHRRVSFLDALYILATQFFIVSASKRWNVSRVTGKINVAL